LARVAAAIVAGGIEALGVQLPAIDSVLRQGILADGRERAGVTSAIWFLRLDKDVATAAFDLD